MSNTPMEVARDLLERLRSLVFRRRDERELDEELRFHLEMETAQRRGLGIDTGEAHRQSRVALGGVERIKDEVRDARGTRLLDDVMSDFVHTLRTMRSRPGFATVVILTLAIGIGGTTAVFSAVDAVLLRPLPYQEPGQLVRLYHYFGGNTTDHGPVTPVHFLAYRSELPSFEHTAAIMAYDAVGADIGGSERPERIRLLPVSADYFGVVRVQPRLGRGFETNEEFASAARSAGDPHGPGAGVVILSHELWERQLQSDPAALGRGFMMGGKSYTIIGVMPEGFADPVVGHVDAFVPEDLTPGRDIDNVDNHYLSVIARLRPGVTLARAQAELDVLGARLARQYPQASHTQARLYPLKDDIVAPASRGLEIVLGAVGLVLLLVCVNVANLLLVRGSERANEFALRSALGAERSRLVRQLLVESLTLALAGDIAGLLVARVAMRAIVVLGAGSIPRLSPLELDPRVLAFSLVVASLSAVVFGLAPALRAARTEPSDVLREQTRSTTASGGQGRLRTSLVISQVALAFVLLAGCGILLASFERLRRVDLGVHTAGVLTFELHLPEARYDSSARKRFYERVAKEIETIHGVRAAGGVSRLPATGKFHSWGAQALTGSLANTKEGSAQPDQRVVSGDYFRAVGIPVFAGRVFDARDDLTTPRHVIVSQSLAERLFPGMNPIGQQLHTGGHTSDIIGVVGNVAQDAEGNPTMYVYHAHTQFAGDRNWALTQIVSVEGPAEPIQQAIRRTIARLDPQLVIFRPMTFEEAIGQGRAQRVFTLRILSSFAAVALALAALGLFGVLSYTVKLRAHEFGIRMALGAERVSIQRMVMRQGLTVTAAGIGVGLIGAVAFSGLMTPMLFHVSPLDPRVLTGAALFMALVATIAAYLPSRRATAVEPRQVL